MKPVHPDRSARALAALVLGSTAIHFVRPAVFEKAVPPRLPGSGRGWVYVSGVAELITGLALLHPRTRRIGGLAAAALFVAVFPANVQMYSDAPEGRGKIIAALRLPLQVPLVGWALRVARRA